LLQSLQAARALAATAVAAFHLSIMMGEDRYGGREVFSEFTARGYLGVAFFFVLSGFIILFAHGADIGKPRALAGYVWRRFVRLFPIYWLYLAVFAVLVGLAGLGTAARLPSGWQEWLTAITLIRFSNDVFPFPVAWSLHHELLFYALFAILILHARAGWAAFGLLALACLSFLHYTGGSGATPLQTYTAASNLYFLMGMGACLLYRKQAPPVPCLALGLAISVVAGLAVHNEVRHAELLLVCGFVLLVAGVVRLEEAGRFAVPAWLVLIGDASYSLYLLHESVSGLLLKIAIKLQLDSALGPKLLYLAVIAGTVALCCLAYLLVEKPLLKLLRRRRAAPAQALAPHASASAAR
jgi:peptidoglycan/LPS O-acetylase OafA/YrhL